MPLLGSDLLPVGRNLHIHLPPMWTERGEQDWLLFPRHLVRSFAVAPGYLTLLPIRPACRTALSRLQASAFEFGLAPDIATHVQTSPHDGTISLTLPQIDWMGITDRRVFAVGLIAHAHLTSWQRWQETDSTVDNPRQ